MAETAVMHQALTRAGSKTPPSHHTRSLAASALQSVMRTGALNACLIAISSLPHGWMTISALQVRWCHDSPAHGHFQWAAGGSGGG
jgi:hypothetical protein